MRVAVISDTHNHVPAWALDKIKKCDAVIHAGDVCKKDTLREIRDAMKENAELYLVRGNNDGHWADELPKVLDVELEGVKFRVAHKESSLPKENRDVDVVIFGHTHLHHSSKKHGVLWLNPGTCCGKLKFTKHLTQSMYILKLKDGHCSRHFYLNGVKLK